MEVITTTVEIIRATTEIFSATAKVATITMIIIAKSEVNKRVVGWLIRC